MRINYKGRDLIFKDLEDGYAQLHLGFVMSETFGTYKTYDDIEFGGRDVVDVGAFCGDTAIYFSLRGAKTVYAYEPFSTFDNIAINCKANGITNVVATKAAIVGKNYPSLIPVNTEFQNAGDSKLTDKNSFTNADYTKIKMIPAINLKQVVEEFNLHNAVLKIDTEGCEYDIIHNTDDDVLKRFTSMVMEVHNIFTDNIQQFEIAKNELKQRLEKLGYKVEIKFTEFYTTCMLYAELKSFVKTVELVV